MEHILALWPKKGLYCSSRKDRTVRVMTPMALAQFVMNNPHAPRCYSCAEEATKRSLAYKLASHTLTHFGYNPFDAVTDNIAHWLANILYDTAEEFVYYMPDPLENPKSIEKIHLQPDDHRLLRKSSPKR